MASMNSFLRRINRFVRGLIGLAAVAVSMLSLSVFAAPMDGMESQYTQPDGTVVTLKFYGDEFYARTETADGYTVVFDPATKTYYYADLSPDGNEFVSTGKKVGKDKPDPEVQKSLRINPESRAAKARKKAEAYEAVVKQQERWEAVKAANRNYQAFKNEVKKQEKAGKKSFAIPVGTIFPDSEIPPAPEMMSPEMAAPAEGDGTTTEDPPSEPAPPSFELSGDVVGLTILVDFSDVPGTAVTQAEVDDYCNKPDYTGFGNAGSVYDYFFIQSGTRLRYNNNVTYYVRVPQPKTYYDDTSLSSGTCGRMLLNDALDVLIADGYDFSQLTTKSGGYVRACNVFFAGDDSGVWAKGLWPHRWVLSPSKTVATDKIIYDYQITDIGSSHDLRIGTFCHENGHMLLGYPDLYSYDGNAANFGTFSLMASGNYGGSGYHPTNIDPYLKTASGWMDIVDLDSTSSQRGTLQVDGNQIYRYLNPSDSLEYFLLEVRDNTGWEGPYGGHLSSVNPSAGIVAYHAKENGSSTYSTIFTADNPNCDYTKPYELLIVEANQKTTITPWYDDPTPDTSDAFKSSGKSDLSDATTPALKFWDATGRNTASGAIIHSISADGPTMTFIAGAGDPTGSPIIALSRSSIDRSCDFGATAESATFSIANGGGGTLSYTITDNQTWLDCTPATGTATTESDTITVTFSTTELAAGIYSATITVEDPLASPTTDTITVSLTVNAQPVIALSVASISATGIEGVSGPQESFAINNTGGGTMSYTMSSTQSWLSLSPSSGTVVSETDTIYADFDATSLAAGTYNDTITVTSAEADNSPQAIPVTFTVQTTEMIVISPNGGEQWGKGETRAITWTSSLGGTVQIDLLKGGVFDSTIVASTTNDGSFDWAIPGSLAAASDYSVEITSIESPTKSDTSDAAFSIIPTLADALDTTGITWTTSGNLPWLPQTTTTHDGVDAAQSGAISDSQTSSLETTLLGSATLTFWWKVSSESSFDFLRFYINDVEQGGDLARISGEVAWVQKTVTIPAGTNTVRWTYTKDHSVSSGSDCGWVDQVVYTPDEAPEIAVEQPLGTDLVDGITTIDFGTVDVGSSSSNYIFTIKNVGNADLTGLALSKSGTHSNDFTLGSLGATTVAPGTSTTFTVTFSPAAPGTRTAALHIASNDADENPFDIALTGSGPGTLAITPAEAFSTSGYVGGPFSPSSKEYTLSNPGGTTIEWTATKTANWVDLSLASGTLAPDASSTVTVSVNSNANSLVLGTYNDTVSFTNTTNGNGNDTRGVSLWVTEPIPDVPTGLTATPYETQVDLAWSAANGADSYNIKRSDTSGGPYVTIDSTNSTSFSDGTIPEVATYYYVVSAVNTGGESADSAEATAVVRHALPFAEEFEARTIGDLDGQDGWASSNAVVQTNLTFAGTQASKITSEVGYLEQTFAGSDSNVWTDMQMQPVFCAETPASFDPTATAVFFFNTNGNPVVFNSTNIQVVSSITVSTGDWVRVTVYTDYTTKKWDFYIDGASVASGLDFYDAANTRYERLQFSGGGPSGAFLDDIIVGTSSPLGGVFIPAPSALSATAASSWQMDLSWTDNSTNETGFAIERSLTSGSGFAQVGSTGEDVTAYSDTGVLPGETYYYRVSATNSTTTSAASAEATATTPKAPATVTLGTLAQTYDSTPREVSYTTDPTNLTVDVTYDGNAWAPTNAGSYAVLATIIDDAYQGSTNGTLVVAKATPTATLQITNSPQTYDGTAQSAAVAIASNSVTGSVANVVNGTQTDAGTYAVTADFVPTDSANYETLTGLAAGDFVIDKATPTVTTWPTASPIVLGQALSASTLSNGTASVTGSFAFTSPATVPATGGVYTAAVTFTPTDTANYTTVAGSSGVDVRVTVTFDKNAAEATDPVPASKTGSVGVAYGELATTSREGHTLDGWFTAAVAGEQVQSNTIVAVTSNHTLYAQWTTNTYTVAFVTDGTIGATLTGTTNQTVTYGEDSTAVTANAPVDYQFVNWTEGGVEYGTSATIIATNVIADMTLTANYALNNALVITAASATNVYDGTALTNNGYDITSGELATNHTLVAVTVTGSQTLAGSSPNVPSAAVIQDADSLDVTDQYTITYANGSLTVTPKDAATLTIGEVGALTYDGTAQTPEPVVSDGATVLTNATDYTLSYAANTNAGSATLTVTGIGNYTGTQDKNFTIDPATLTVTPDAGQSKLYGAADPALAYTNTGAVASETAAFNGTLARAAGEDVGTYAISVGTLALADNTPFLAANYTLSFTAGVTFDITQATPTVSAWPTASPILLGQTLSASTLSNGTASVDGSFAFTNPNTEPAEGGTNVASVTFTPTDTTNYTTVAGSVDVWVDASVVLPFSEDFEGLVLGDLNGQSNWLASGAVVQTNLVYEGLQAAEIAGEGYVQREFTDAQTNVWTDFRFQPAFLDGEPSNLDADSTAVFYFNTNGHPVVYDGLTPVVVSNVTVTTGEWVRVTVNSDYVAKTWNLHINGALQKSDIGFYDAAATHYTTFSVKGAGTATVPLDALLIDLTSPFAGLPLLTVTSAHGSPSPAVGTWSYDLDTAINAYMADAIITDDLIRYVCTGWIGNGSGLASGTSTNFTFTITEDTTITWQWQTNYWVNLEVAGE